MTPAAASSPGDSGEFGVAWSRLVKDIEACRRCPLGAQRQRVVVYRGGRHPTVVFVGEAPGREEDRAGVPFVGRSGHRLDRAIAQLDLTPESFGVLNLVKCRPPANRLPAGSVESCRPFLDRQLELLAPARLVTLGRTALNALDPTAPPITQVSGRPRRGGRAVVFPLLHPAAALRSRRWNEQWDRDIRRLSRWLGRPGSEPL